MKKLQSNQRLLITAAGFLLLSILLMIIIIPGVYAKSLPNEKNMGAVIGISLAIIIRLLILNGYRLIIKKIRRDGEAKKAGYISIGILLILFGLIYSDGPFAFHNNEGIPYVSYLMFASVGCDLIAAILTFVALLFRSQKIKRVN